MPAAPPKPRSKPEDGAFLLPSVQAVSKQWRGKNMEPWQAIIIGAVGTWIIAIVAVGDRLFNILLRPRLRVEPDGFSDAVAEHDNGHKARYYLIRVRNCMRWVRPAHESELLIVRIEKSGQVNPVFEEFMPLPWQRGELYPLRPRTIGRDGIAALFFVQDDGVLGITPALGPGGVLARHFPVMHAAPVTLWITLEATSIEVDSPSRRLKIVWDGQWQADIEKSCHVSDDPPRRWWRRTR